MRLLRYFPMLLGFAFAFSASNSALSKNEPVLAILKIDIDNLVFMHEKCIVASASVYQSTQFLPRKINIMLKHKLDLFDLTSPYLAILSENEGELKGCNEKNSYKAFSKFQSLFPLLDVDFCDLEDKCKFLITRRSVFQEELKDYKIDIYNNIYGYKRISAEAELKEKVTVKSSYTWVTQEKSPLKE